ncbi:protein of unknown function [Chitinophaga sp. CF118]|uniref:eCIS core domain-containing protein n=1 Tax=Chitinophaga sp. CF118 TaxID=1884367 RepID=UPI0008F37965|nr:DUF4157 domain-containing protein [Chitinophaga sp. CF118]SFF10005.1 protein of unknown function [Chitinophaga sp. CF118]
MRQQYTSRVDRTAKDPTPVKENSFFTARKSTDSATPQAFFTKRTIGRNTLPIQAKQSSPKQTDTPAAKKNNTGLPDTLKVGIENMSGLAMDDVKVHYNSDRPARLQAAAFTQDRDIHLGPGEEKHLPHEAWHVVQQSQGRVQPTTQLKGVSVNDNATLEQEADVMGTKVATGQSQHMDTIAQNGKATSQQFTSSGPVAQLVRKKLPVTEKPKKDKEKKEETSDDEKIPETPIDVLVIFFGIKEDDAKELFVKTSEFKFLNDLDKNGLTRIIYNSKPSQAERENKGLTPETLEKAREKLKKYVVLESILGKDEDLLYFAINHSALSEEVFGFDTDMKISKEAFIEDKKFSTFLKFISYLERNKMVLSAEEKDNDSKGLKDSRALLRKHKFNDPGSIKELIKGLKEEQIDLERFGALISDIHSQALTGFSENIQQEQENYYANLPSAGGGGSGDWAMGRIRTEARNLASDSRNKSIFPNGKYTIHHKVSQSKLKKLHEGFELHPSVAASFGNKLLSIGQDYFNGSTNTRKILLNLPFNLEVGPPGDRRIDDPGSGFDYNRSGNGIITPRSKVLEDIDAAAGNEDQMGQKPFWDELAVKLERLRKLQNDEEKNNSSALSTPKLEQWQEEKGKHKRVN